MSLRHVKKMVREGAEEQGGGMGSLHMDDTNWAISRKLFKRELISLEKSFGVKYTRVHDKVLATTETDDPSLESASLSALLHLQRTMVTSTVSRTVEDLSPSERVRLEATPRVALDCREPPWKLVGRTVEDLRRALASGDTPMNEEEEGDLCPVCMDTVTEGVTLGCKHVLCKACLTALIKHTGPSCPVCRTSFGERNTRPVSSERRILTISYAIYTRPRHPIMTLFTRP
jgi:hypothetical protein